MKRSFNLLAAGLTVGLMVAIQWGCAGPATKAKPVETTPAQAILSGKVVETMDAGGYTYVCLEKNGVKTWVAAPIMKIAVGDEVQLLPGTEMTNFSSKALNRTFEKIVFSGGSVQKPATKPEPAPQKPGAEQTKGEPLLLAGKVVETMKASGYTYIYLEKDGKRSWAAVPATSVKVGDEIELLPGTEMGRFTSKSMNRTFENILFSRGVKGAAAGTGASVPEGHPALPKKEGDPTGTPANSSPVTPNLAGKVVETANAGGYTYICLEKDGKKTWAAVPTMNIRVGDVMELAPGVEMKQFPSKALNRTFESIIFSSGPVTIK